MKKQKLKNKLSNMKGSKGITLVALIITIIVLLILAVVAISSVNNTGIIQYAQNSADEYKDGREKENTTLQNYMDVLNHYNPNTETEGSGAKQDDAKRLEEIVRLLYFSDEFDYDKETTPQEEINRIKAEEEKLELEYLEIIGDDIISFAIDFEEYSCGYLYNSETQKFFKSTISDDEVKIEYVSKEDEGNAILAEVVAFKEYLGEEFIGMPYDDIREMAAEDKLIHYIKERYEPSKEFENLRSSNASAGVMIKCNQKSQEFLDSYYYIHYHFNDQYSNEDKVRKITTSNDLLCD